MAEPGGTAATRGADDPEVAACLETFADFRERYRPTWLHRERTVRYATPRSHSYVRTFDRIAEIDCPACGPGTRCRWLLNWKTGSLHVAAQSLQLAAYRGAQQLTTWVPKTKRFVCPEAGLWSCELDAPHTHCPVCGDVGAHRPYAQAAYHDEVVDGPMPRGVPPAARHLRVGVGRRAAPARAGGVTHRQPVA